MKKVLIFIIPYLFTVSLFQFIGAQLSGISILNMNHIRSSNQILTIKFFDLIGTLIIVSIFVKYFFKDSFLDLGFKKTGFSKQFVAATLLVCTGISTVFFILLTINEIKIASINFNFWELIKSCLIFLCVAFIEELLFRGYIQKYLMQSMNKYIALIVASIFFSIAHFLNPNISIIGTVGIFTLGLLLGLSYIYTKSLWFPIVFHFWWNFIQVHLGFNVSGKELYSLTELSKQAPNILNGGAFGFEGSLLSFPAQMIILAGLYFFFRQNTITLKT
ncbi:lysostaphin resistance A-like protein [Carboxylicivirga caseinilyticus]|uniref:CPBP family intramembrane glutamic endopeptidase n=1 Tax=Carboxylicivirga caseinilyticus TaxID=3417572 RepID=UPI003D348897|nr:CPBP family intramembrane metalloprotease [Marinilabiliaceae bacterium A049]